MSVPDMRGRPIAITMGDPAGIGPEIVVKLAASLNQSSPSIVIVGEPHFLSRAAEMAGVKIDLREIGDPDEIDGWEGGVVAVVRPDRSERDEVPIGKVSAIAGAIAYDCLIKAIDLAIAGKISAIVTAPINKEALAAAGILQPGHTEILAERAGVAEVAMMLANDELRVLLVSIHLSLADAISAVSNDSELRAIRFADAACKAIGIERPRVAVAGLNPHAGENGMFGVEDRTIIAPAIQQARNEGIDASGPWPGDTVFMRARKGEFDIVVAQYHDQGLIPIKLMGVEHGVNVTVGLPFIRTSVDHGTAFDIAGTGLADHSSLQAALRHAVAMTKSGLGSAGLYGVER